MQRSVSILLPVKDAQATLHQNVHEILDVVADSGEPFELLIIDDGSTDATSEVAHELTRDYPQVRLIRHAAPLGQDAAIRSGLRRSRGQTVLLRDNEQGFSVLERRPEPYRLIPSRPAQPNYLRRVKDFVLGE
ncbi:MAG: glycosyltransferase [Planctomycetaceae bacterium]|nr:glycosyltransferase [Planctomycetaceae bacterium]